MVSVDGGMPMKASFIVIAVGLALGGCTSIQKINSIHGGEAKIFERPQYEVRGATRYDQDWIDSQVEGGVAAFGWERPAPRPPELDHPSQRLPTIAAKPAKKPRLLKRIKNKLIKPKAMPTPVSEPSPVVPAEIVPPPPPPRKPIDELLQPRG